MLITQMAAGIKSGYESWRDFEHEATEGESFHEWAICKAKVYAQELYESVSG